MSLLLFAFTLQPACPSVPGNHPPPKPQSLSPALWSPTAFGKGPKNTWCDNYYRLLRKIKLLSCFCFSAKHSSGKNKVVTHTTPHPGWGEDTSVSMMAKHFVSPLHSPLCQELWSFRPRKRGLSWIIPKGKDGSCGFEVKVKMAQLGRSSVSPAREQVWVRECLWW